MLQRLLTLLAETLDPGARAMYVDRAHILHVIETRERDGDDLDEFGRQYVADLRRRIARGLRPERNLLESRPHMLYFRDAIKKASA